MKTGISWLDVKLGVRMLLKHPALAVVGGLGMAVAIAIGAGSYAFFDRFLHPSLPLDEGDRVVGIQSWDTERNRGEPRSLHDFAAWRRELRSVRDVGAFRAISRNLIVPGMAVENVQVAEMTASGFRVARVAPLRGRPLVDADERAGAPGVVVIGERVWRERFASDPAVLGRELRLGADVHTVVGVMPEGFAFPVNHSLWVPLRADPADYERRSGPALSVFGRLADGASLEQAQAEVATLGRRASAAFPATHARLRPRVVPYTALWNDDFTVGQMLLVRALVVLLLVVICANVASLVYARTATRQGEIVVRTALGASRRRIVAQLFAEALVLSAAAAAVGLGITRIGLMQLEAFLQEQPGGAPFWTDVGLSARTVGYSLALTLLGAVIVGVVPALQATGRRVEAGLREIGGNTRMRLGRTWTVLIVAQVAFAVAVLPTALHIGTLLARMSGAGPGFPAEEFAVTELAMDYEVPSRERAAAYGTEFDARLGAFQSELRRRLQEEPGVAGVTFALTRPGAEPTWDLEVERSPLDRAPAPAGGHDVRYNQVDPDFFRVFGMPVLAGRALAPADADTAARAVVVNRAFVTEVLGGGSALGRRVRYVNEDDYGAGSAAARWHEIVGVVSDLPAGTLQPGLADARVYHAFAPGTVHPVETFARLRGVPPGTFARRLGEITTGIDPTLRLQETVTLAEVYRRNAASARMGALALGVVILSVLLLSSAGIYALMSFTVARRRREIGIRSALGAHPRRLLGGIFSRVFAQISVGVALGAAAAVGVAGVMESGDMPKGEGWVLPAVAAIMLAVGVVAAIGPARRGLRIQPTEALKAEW